MRILHIDTGSVMRGGQELLMMSARGLRATGHVQAIACPPGSPLAAMATAEGFSVLPIERPYFKAARPIRRFLRAQPHDLVSSHDARAQTVAYLATLGLPIVRVANRLVVFEPRNRLVHRLKYKYTCDMVVALSQAVKDTLVRSGIPAEHVEVITGGIDFPEQLAGPGARERMRANWGLSPEHFVIGHVAAFTEEKGQLDALDALIALLPEHPNIRLLLVGDGPLREDPKTQERVRASGGAAQLPGYLKPTAEFYAGLDLSLVNSTAEALGLSALYAMAHEVPVIATNVGGLPEVVGDAGWLVPPSDPRALAKTIEKAIECCASGAMRERGKRAREHARRFSSEVTARRTETVYDELIRARKLPGSQA
ncbi:MAG TPA: glycosyltransferase family 4 protein [Bryobacteraceae bacterium]|nr:glycosyltransferase family 4 protein [Bryobacteraceae bacterium]